MTVVELAPQTLKGEMRVMDRSGDKHWWDRTNDAEIAAVADTFEALRHKGFQAFRVDASGNQGELIRQFDPDAEVIVMLPAMQGG